MAAAAGTRASSRLSARTSSQSPGRGFNSDTGLSPGVALDFMLPDTVASSETEADVTIITSHEELMSSLLGNSEFLANRLERGFATSEFRHVGF